MQLQQGCGVGVEEVQDSLEVAKLKVPDWTLEEDRRLILAQLPPSLLKQVVKEDHRHMGGDPTSLQIWKPPEVTEITLLPTMEFLWGYVTQMSVPWHRIRPL